MAKCLYNSNNKCSHRVCIEAEEDGSDSRDYRWTFTPLFPESPPVKKEEEKKK
jgi:hypothetical protein